MLLTCRKAIVFGRTSSFDLLNGSTSLAWAWCRLTLGRQLQSLTNGVGKAVVIMCAGYQFVVSLQRSETQKFATQMAI